MGFEEQMLALLSNYGWQIFTISAIIILIVGTIKYFDVFKKIQNKNTRKCIYYGLDFILSFGLVAVYYAIYKIDFSTYLIYCCKTIPAVTTMYAIYENFGLRKIVSWFGNFIIKKVAIKQLEAAKNEIIATPKNIEEAPAEKIKEAEIIQPETIVTEIENTNK